MTKTGVLIATVLALVLGVATLLTDSPRRAEVQAGSGPLLGSLDIGSISRIEVHAARGGCELRRLDLLPDMWVLSTDSPAPWPVNARSVFATLRMLAELSIEPGRAASKSEFATLILHAQGGVSVELRIASQAVAGRSEIATPDGRVALASDDGLSRVFATGDLGAWKVPDLFPLDAAGASRVFIEEAEKRVALARVGRSWALTAPQPAKADDPVVTTVLGQLAQSAMLKTAGASEAGTFDRPVARIAVETDRQVGEAGKSRLRITQELAVGPSSGIGGDAVLCRLQAWTEDSAAGGRMLLWGPVVAAVDRRTLAGISGDARSYFARVAVAASAADVFRIRAERLEGPSVEVTREAESWKTTSSTGARVEPAAEAAIVALLNFLTVERAKAVLPRESAPFEPVALLFVAGRDGSEIAGLELGRTSVDGASQAVLGVRSMGVVRVYETPAAQLAKLLDF